MTTAGLLWTPGNHANGHLNTSEILTLHPYTGGNNQALMTALRNLRTAYRAAASHTPTPNQAPARWRLIEDVLRCHFTIFADIETVKDAVYTNRYPTLPRWQFEMTWALLVAKLKASNLTYNLHGNPTLMLDE